MIRKVLIANRGEIACRVIRTCAALGIRTVAVHSEADARALHVALADEAVQIGPSAAAESYLNSAAILAAARLTGADAVHPGYGFLAENAAFARAVTEAGLIFIGPPAAVIERMGSKRAAKRLLRNIPLVPGYSGDDQSDDALLTAARDTGFPLLIKASAGGGGKGMRVVHSADHFPEAMTSARREAQQAFGDSTLLLEQLIDRPRHVEVQIFGDAGGGVIALGERDCSIQRRHQKIIEETPSPAVTTSLRADLCAAAVEIGRQLGYVGAGTVEFLLDLAGRFYFLEVNTRLQVEHPVTELVTGLDLVEWQIRVAEGERLPTHEVVPNGHAIECRLYAEDPVNGFLPVTGTILRWEAPPNVRCDSGIQTGDVISPHYDPILAKVIAHGRTRAEALRRLRDALDRTVLLGLTTNLGLLRRIAQHDAFSEGTFDTGFLDQHPDLLADDSAPPAPALIAAALTQQTRPTPPDVGYWRNNPHRPIQHHFRAGATTHVVELTPRGADHYLADIDGVPHEVAVRERGTAQIALSIDGWRQRVTFAQHEGDCWLHTFDGTFRLTWIDPLPSGRVERESTGSLRSPMPGQVIAVLVHSGQHVSKGDTLLVVEAMKMEHRIQAPHDGLVTAIYFETGQSVQAGVTLLELRASDEIPPADAAPGSSPDAD